MRTATNEGRKALTKRPSHHEFNLNVKVWGGSIEQKGGKGNIRKGLLISVCRRVMIGMCSSHEALEKEKLGQKVPKEQEKGNSRFLRPYSNSKDGR